MGGGGGSQRSETRTDIPEEFKPFVQFGLGEARRLYEQGGPQYYPGQTFVSPSEATQTALGLAERRALAGSPLLQQAQQTIAGQMGYTSPYAQQIQQLGMSAADPSADFYRSVVGSPADPTASNVYRGLAAGAGGSQSADFYGRLMGSGAPAGSTSFYETMMAGSPASEAQEMARRTASGAFLEPNPYLKGALSQANRLAAESYQEGLRGLQSQASAAGRYGSGAMGQQLTKGQDVFARALAEQNQQAYLQNYMQERAAQENAIGRLGSMEQQALANRFAGASGLTAAQQQALQNQIAGAQGMSAEQQRAIQNQIAGAQGISSEQQRQLANQMAASGALTAGQQQALATQLGALGAAQGISAQDLARQQQAASMAPGLAAQDYADIQRLADIGAAREGQAGAQLQADMQRFAYEQNLPYQELQRYASLISGAPMGTTTTQTATPTGGK